MRRRVLLVAAAALAAGCGRGGVTGLFAAAEAGDADAVRRALAAGAEPSPSSTHSSSAVQPRSSTWSTSMSVFASTART